MGGGMGSFSWAASEAAMSAAESMAGNSSSHPKTNLNAMDFIAGLLLMAVHNLKMHNVTSGCLLSIPWAVPVFGAGKRVVKDLYGNWRTGLRDFAARCG